MNEKTQLTVAELKELLSGIHDGDILLISFEWKGECKDEI